MSNGLLTAAFATDLKAIDKIVLVALADYADDAGKCWPSIPTIAKKAGLSEREVYRALKRLVDLRHLSQKVRPGKGCIYHVHPCPTVTPAHARQSGVGVTDSQGTPDQEAGDPCHTVTQTLKEPSSKQDEAKASKARASKAALFPCPTGCDVVDWQSLLQTRASNRKPMTAGAYRAILAKLEGWARDGWPPGPILALAAERGWMTVFPSDEMKGQNERDAKRGVAPGGGRASRYDRDNRDGFTRALDEKIFGKCEPFDAAGATGRRNAGSSAGDRFLPPPGPPSV